MMEKSRVYRSIWKRFDPLHLKGTDLSCNHFPNSAWDTLIDIVEPPIEGGISNQSDTIPSVRSAIDILLLNRGTTNSVQFIHLTSWMVVGDNLCTLAKQVIQHVPILVREFIKLFIRLTSDFLDNTKATENKAPRLWPCHANKVHIF